MCTPVNPSFTIKSGIYWGQNYIHCRYVFVMDMCAQQRLKSVCASIEKLCILGYTKCVQWRLWSYCANAQSQSDLNLRKTNMSEGTFSGVAGMYINCCTGHRPTNYLTYKAPSKFCSRRHSKYHFFFFVNFHRPFTLNVKICILHVWKKKQNNNNNNKKQQQQTNKQKYNKNVVCCSCS